MQSNPEEYKRYTTVAYKKGYESALNQEIQRGSSSYPRIIKDLFQDSSLEDLFRYHDVKLSFLKSLVEFYKFDYSGVVVASKRGIFCCGN
jgi:hypothetical protein